MAFRFWRRIRIAPGLRLNLSKSGVSLSFGRRGARFTVGRRGRRATLGIPGTGLFYTTGASGRRRTGSRGVPVRQVPAVPREERLTLGFFKRLVTPKHERAFVDGCRELTLGRGASALQRLRRTVHLADGAYLAGFLALSEGSLPEAANYLAAAARMHKRLGRYFGKYGIAATISLPITDEVAAHVGPTLRGVLLGLVEVYQRQKDWRSAAACLQRLQRLAPGDVVVKLSLAEVLMEVDQDNRRYCERVVHLAKGLQNEGPIHAALLLYRARALRGLGLSDAARNTLTTALRRRKGRSDDLLRALRYERALVYECLGQNRRSRSDLEKLYAEAPEHEDVPERLGIA